MIALSEASPHGAEDEALPPYTPSRSSGRTSSAITQLHPHGGTDYESEKLGVPPLPQYGYTAHEPQVHDDSELEMGYGRASLASEHDHMIDRTQSQTHLSPLRRHPSQ